MFYFCFSSEGRFRPPTGGKKGRILMYAKKRLTPVSKGISYPQYAHQSNCFLLRDCSIRKLSGLNLAIFSLFCLVMASFKPPTYWSIYSPDLYWSQGGQKSAWNRRKSADRRKRTMPAPHACISIVFECHGFFYHNIRKCNLTLAMSTPWDLHHYNAVWIMVQSDFSSSPVKGVGVK